MGGALRTVGKSSSRAFLRNSPFVEEKIHIPDHLSSKESMPRRKRLFDPHNKDGKSTITWWFTDSVDSYYVIMWGGLFIIGGYSYWQVRNLSRGDRMELEYLNTIVLNMDTDHPWIDKELEPGEDDDCAGNDLDGQDLIEKKLEMSPKIPETTH